MGRDRDGVRGADDGKLLDGNHERDRIEAGATKRLGPRDTEQPEVRHLPHVLPRKGLIGVMRRGDGGHLLLREGAHHLTGRDVMRLEVG